MTTSPSGHTDNPFECKSSFRISQFETVKLPDDVLIVLTPHRTFSVSSGPMTEMLSDLKKQSSKPLLFGDLMAMLGQKGLHPTAGLNFLRDDLGVLTPLRIPEDQVTRVQAIVDHPHLGIMLSESLGPLHNISFEWRRIDADWSVSDESPVLLIMALTDYCAGHIKELYRRFGDRSSVGFITTFVHRTHFVVDGAYLPHKGTPCHFCHRHWFDGETTEDCEAPNESWMSLKRQLRHEDHVPSLVPLTTANLGIMASTLNFEIQALLGVTDHLPLSDRVGASVIIDMLTGKRQLEKVPHAPSCACLAGTWS